LVSPWLERLNIMGCDIPISWKRESPLGMRIATPRLRYLHLSDSEDYYEWSSRNCTAPMSLESMPLLTSASIQLVGSTTIHIGDDAATADRPLLLHGLSEATSLELIASTSDGMVCQNTSLNSCCSYT
jgi:hypothetical protein